MSNNTIPSTQAFQIYKRLLGYVYPHRYLFALGILGTMLSSGVDASLTWTLKPLLDQGFIAKNQTFIHVLPILIIVAFLFRGAAGFMENYCITRVGRTVVMTLRQQMFGHLLQLPASFYDSNSSGQLLAKLLFNVEQVAKASTDSLITIIRESCFIVGLLTVMLVISWKLTLLFAFIAPIIVMISRRSSRRMRGQSHGVQQSVGDIGHIAEEAIEGYKVVRTFGGENYEREKFNAAAKKNRQRELKIVSTNSLAIPAVQMTIAVVVALTIYLATTETVGITAGGFAAILAAMLAILKPLKNMTTVSSSIQKGIAAAESIFTLLDEKAEKDLGQQTLVRAKGAIEYRHVHFTFQSSERKVLHEINLRIEPGQTVALVGRSGSGKSTLVSLLPRFYDDYSGLISIDGQDIRSLRLADLRRQFALVSQHVVLFNDTIANNIAYGVMNSVSEAEIIRVATAAHAMEFIKDLPQGLQTLVGENGVLLSGGQRQRIAIARALLKDAPILILDEATSALDTESERHIQTALHELMKNRTTLVIAHRLSTIENADQIIVLADGHVVEEGTHQHLITQTGNYARLHSLQFESV